MRENADYGIHFPLRRTHTYTHTAIQTQNTMRISKKKAACAPCTRKYPTRWNCVMNKIVNFVIRCCCAGCFCAFFLRLNNITTSCASLLLQVAQIYAAAAPRSFESLVSSRETPSNRRPRLEMRSFSLLCGDANASHRWTVTIRLSVQQHTFWCFRIRWWLLYICSFSTFSKTANDVPIEFAVYAPRMHVWHKVAEWRFFGHTRDARFVPFYFVSRSSNWIIIKRSSLGNVLRSMRD